MDKEQGSKKGSEEGAKIKFKEVTYKEPWDVFAEQGSGARDGVSKKDAAHIAKAYHKFAEEKRVILGACVVCGSRVRKSSKEKGKTE